MSFKLDDELLADLGLGHLPPAHRALLLKGIYEELEIRVGTRLAEGFTAAQLAEFEPYYQRGDDEGALAWLTQNAPDYTSVVAQEFERLCAEVRLLASDIDALSTAFSLPDGEAGPARHVGRQREGSP